MKQKDKNIFGAYSKDELCELMNACNYTLMTRRRLFYMNWIFGHHLPVARLDMEGCSDLSHYVKEKSRGVRARGSRSERLSCAHS